MQVDVARAAQRAGISFESEVLDAIAFKASEEIKDLEDKRFLLEVRMALSDVQMAALKKQLMRSTKKDIIEHAMNETKDREKLLCQAMDLQRSLEESRRGISQRDDVISNSVKGLEFWKKQAFQLQHILNEMMVEMDRADTQRGESPR